VKEDSSKRGAASAQDRRIHWSELAALTVILILGAILRFHALGQKSIWVDEGVSIELARLDWYNFLRILWRHEGNMALYHLLLRVWLPFGSSEAYIRTLSVLPALGTIPALYGLGRKLFNSQVGLISAFLLAVNAYHVRYSQEARSYSLYPLLCVLSSFYLVSFLQEPSRRNRIGHVLTSALAVYAHFFSGLLIVAQWLWLRCLDRKDLRAVTKKNWRIFSISIAPEVLFVLTTGTGVLRWIPKPGLADLKQWLLFTTGNDGMFLAMLYIVMILAAIWRPEVWKRLRHIGWASWRYCFLLLWLLFPVIFVFLLSQLKPFFLSRYFVFTLPALALLAACGVCRLRAPILIGLLLFAFAFFSMKGVSHYYERDFDIAREDWRSATRYVVTNTQPGDAIVFHQPIGRMPYEYYKSVTQHNAEAAVLYPQHGEKLTYRDFYAGRATDEFLNTIPALERRAWIVFTYNEVNSAPDSTTSFITNLFAHEYKTVQSKKFDGIEVRLYSR